MKKIAVVLLAMMLLLTSVTSLAEEVDAYSSASMTKLELEDDVEASAAAALSQNGSDLASKAQSEEEGYTRNPSQFGYILTTNPDGCPGISTIGSWRYVDNRTQAAGSVTVNAGDKVIENRGEGADQVFFALSYGQNVQNLIDNGRGTLLVKLEEGIYLVHLKVADYYEFPYDDAALEAGLYPVQYTGAEAHLSVYYISCDVMGIEESTNLRL